MRAIVLVSLLLPSVASAQTDVEPALAALLACEAAEHAAWLHGYGVLNETYELGTERQREAALRRLDDVLDACGAVPELLPEPLRAPFEQDVLAWWQALSLASEDPESMVSDLLSSMQNVGSGATIEALLASVAAGEAQAPPRLVATARRRLTSEHLRQAAAVAQAAVSTQASDLAALRYDLETAERAERGAARARLAEGTRALSTLRAARRSVLSAMVSWRRGAARTGVLRSLERAVDPIDYPSLAEHLVD